MKSKHSNIWKKFTNPMLKICSKLRKTPSFDQYIDNFIDNNVRKYIFFVLIDLKIIEIFY